MSGPSGAAPPTVVLGLGLDVQGLWHQRAVQRSRALVQTYLLTNSVHPLPAAGGSKAPLRLPALVGTARGPGQRDVVAQHSHSEPSLLTLNDNVHFEGVSRIRPRSILQKRPPAPPPLSKSVSLLPCSTTQPHSFSRPPQQHKQPHVQSSCRPTYMHFSHAIQPGTRSRPARRHSHNPTLGVDTGDLRPVAMQCCDSLSQVEPLYVIGKPCLLSCGHRSAPAEAAAAGAAAGPGRARLHVFLPSEAEGEEVDSESVDEGFMDELDCKRSSLKLQQEAVKTLTHH